MKVTQEKLPDSQIKLDIEIPASTCKQVYEQVLQKMARSLNIPGFRKLSKGKVSKKLLQQREKALLRNFGQKPIKAEALEKLVQDGLKQAIEQESIEAIGNYQLISEFEELLNQYNPEESLHFFASVDVPPQINLGDYQNLSVKAEETKYEPTQVEKYLEEQRSQQATLVPVEDRPANNGDVTVVDYQGKLAGNDGEPGAEIPGATATDAEVELKEGLFIEDLIAGIVGMTIGETKDIPVQFPEDYPKDDLASAQAVFTVTLKEIKEKELPELDDDFAQDVSEFETLTELQESLESRFRTNADNSTKASVEQALVEALEKVVNVELPETMIEQEIEAILTQRAIQLESYGMDVKSLFTREMIPQMKKNTRPDAIRNITQSLSLLEIAKVQGIEPSPEEQEAKIAEVTEQLSGRNFDADRLKEAVKEDLTKEKVLAWLQERSTVELVPQGSLEPKEEETLASESPTQEAIETASEEPTAESEVTEPVPEETATEPAD